MTKRLAVHFRCPDLNDAIPEEQLIQINEAADFLMQLSGHTREHNLIGYVYLQFGNVDFVGE